MLISRAEYCLLLNGYKEFRDNCRGCYNRNESFCKVCYNVKCIDTFINRTEIYIFTEGKSFVYKINYKDDPRNIYVK